MKEIISFLRYVVDPRKVKSLVLSVLITVGLVLAGCRAQHHRDMIRHEAETAVIVAEYEAQIKELHAAAEAGIYATQYLDNEYSGDAWTLAQWLGCLERMYPGITAEAKGLACWGVFARVESSEYPDDILSVLQQPGQFNEFDDGEAPTEENVTIATNQLSRFHNGDIRPAPSSAVFITVNADGVVLRDSFSENNRTNYWRA